MIRTSWSNCCLVNNKNDTYDKNTHKYTHTYNSKYIGMKMCFVLGKAKNRDALCTYSSSNFAAGERLQKTERHRA